MTRQRTILAILGVPLLFVSAALAAPSTASGPGEDAAASAPAVAGIADPTADANAPPGSTTIRMLLELQQSKPPVERLEGSSIVRSAPQRSRIPAPPVVPEAVNPFRTAVEQAKPSATREPATVARPAAWVPAQERDAGADAQAPRGSAGSGRHLSGLSINLWLPLALMQFIRENRYSVLGASMAALALVAFSASRAAHRRR
jgi:hypothetical protein